MAFHQSVSLPMFLPAFSGPEALVAAIAEIGFQGIEIWGRDAHFKTWLELAARYRLTLSSMVGHRAAMNRPECHAEAQRELRESIDIAADHGIPGLICFSGQRQEGQSDGDALEAVVEGLRGIIPYAEEKNVTLLLELLNSKVDHPGYLADHTAWGVEVCRRAGSPRLRLLYDIYHMQIMEGDVIRTLRDNIGWIGHFHTAGNPGRHEIGAAQELNYAAIAAAIRETPFAGFVAHEFKPVGDPLEALREAFAIMSAGARKTIAGQS